MYGGYHEPARERGMRLTIFAATGGIGRQVLEQAVGAGHEVTAVVRNPAKLPRAVRAVTSDLAAPDPTALESAVKGADAVLSGLGPRSASEAGIAWQGTRSIVEAMKATGVRRIIVISAALRKHYADLALMEDVLRDSGLDWTVVRPPRLTDKPATRSYRIAYGQNLRRGLFISRAD